MQFPDALNEAVRKHKYNLLFATVSGAHLYGFPSPDSDYDLRGVHILPVDAVVGLYPGEETVEISEFRDDIELDLVTHDIKKFFNLMLKKNGYVLEQLFSPLIVHSSQAHDELKQIGLDCITRHHDHHYRGFASNQWKLFLKENPPRVKPLLYVYRVLLTGINLMRTGVIEADLLKLNQEFGLPYISELVERKVNSKEKQTLSDTDLSFHEREFSRLMACLNEAAAETKLPAESGAKPALDDLLKRLRLASLSSNRSGYSD